MTWLTVRQLVQIALGLMKLVNWITRRIDQAEWERQGYNKAMAVELAELNKNLGFADVAVADAQKATPEERRKSLEDDL